MLSTVFCRSTWKEGVEKCRFYVTWNDLSSVIIKFKNEICEKPDDQGPIEWMAITLQKGFRQNFYNSYRLPEKMYKAVWRDIEKEIAKGEKNK